MPERDAPMLKLYHISPAKNSNYSAEKGYYTSKGAHSSEKSDGKGRKEDAKSQKTAEKTAVTAELFPFATVIGMFFYFSFMYNKVTNFY